MESLPGSWHGQRCLQFPFAASGSVWVEGSRVVSCSGGFFAPEDLSFSGVALIHCSFRPSMGKLTTKDFDLRELAMFPVAFFLGLGAVHSQDLMLR
jgi:hypothetical protein